MADDKTMPADEPKVADESGQPLMFGAEEMQGQMHDEDEKGYRGERVNPIALDEYTLRTGPKAPTVLDEQAAMAKEATPNV